MFLMQHLQVFQSLTNNLKYDSRLQSYYYDFYNMNDNTITQVALQLGLI